MSKFSVILQPSAQKDIRRLEKREQQKVLRALDALSGNPRPVGCKRLAGSEAWRIRVGDIRILYFIEDQILRVEVVRVAHRKEAYR